MANEMISENLELTQQEITEAIEAKLPESFAKRDTGRPYYVTETARLLESALIPVVLALHNKLWIPGTADLPKPPTNTQLRGEADTVYLEPDQVVELNRHPFVRTQDEAWLGRRLRVGYSAIAAVARKNGLVPVTRYPRLGDPKADDPAFYQGFYDRDQRKLIEEGIKRQPAPKGYIAVSKVVEQVGFEAYEKAVAKLGFPSMESAQFGDKDSKQPTPYIATETAAEILKKIYRE